MYQITRIVNNNIVCSKDEKNRELILRGLGIGFGKKKGETVEDSQIEKIYRISNHSAASKLETLLSSIPYEQIEVSNQIIEYAKDVLAKSMSDNIHITLTDHINFALQRHTQNMDLTNPMLLEIRRFYPTEYAIALHGLDMIEERIGVRLSEDEAGFIALHLVNAELDTDMNNTVQITEMINKVIGIVESFCGQELNRDSVHYERFVTHLKFFGQRLMQNLDKTQEDEEELCQMVFKQYPDEFSCAKMIGEYLQEEFEQAISNSEKMCLTIHIKRIIIDLIE